MINSEHVFHGKDTYIQRLPLFGICLQLVVVDCCFSLKEKKEKEINESKKAEKMNRIYLKKTIFYQKDCLPFIEFIKLYE